MRFCSAHFRLYIGPKVKIAQWEIVEWMKPNILAICLVSGTLCRPKFHWLYSRWQNPTERVHITALFKSIWRKLVEGYQFYTLHKRIYVIIESRLYYSFISNSTPDADFIIMWWISVDYIWFIRTPVWNFANLLLCKDKSKFCSKKKMW